MSYRAKLQLAFLSLGLVAIGVTAYEVSVGATEALRKATYDRLTAIRQTHVRQIEQWFQDLGNHTLALASDEATISALEAFTASWAKLPPPSTTNLQALYSESKLPSIWIPTDPRVLTLQHHFIAANPHPFGQKDRLLNGPAAYGEAHARYHPTLHRYQSAFGFYDVLLISSTDARVVYSVFKEFDLGTSLNQPPYNQSPLARIYQRAMLLTEPEQFVLQDFEPYIPSYSDPAAFLAAPVWRGGVKTGVLAIQVSAKELNRLITAERLGQTGRVSIVGPDGTLRTGDSILRERIADFRHDIEETEVAADSEGRQRLRSHARLRIPNLDWALMTEIDASEALAPISDLRTRILVGGALVALAILIAATWLARSVTRPVFALASAADRLGQRDFSARIPITSKDEIGQLAASFNRMAEQLESTTVSKSDLEALAARLITAQEDERQRIARELHDDISQRLAALAIEAGSMHQADPIKQKIAQLARDIHGLSHRLHPKLLDDLGLVAAIEAECRACFERGGPLVEFTATGDWSIATKPVVLALFRIVQESLRNIEKHAAAEEVAIDLSQHANTAHLRVTDNGRGFATRRPGLGLASMEERARSLSGRFLVESSPGQGTKIEVWLPLDAQDNHTARG
jgi:signal transduction histidine kinase